MRKGLLAAVPLLLVPPALLVSQLPSEEEIVVGPEGMKEGPIRTGDRSFHLGMKTNHFPWKGDVEVVEFDLREGAVFEMDFDLQADMRRAEGFYDDIEAMYVVVVGEPVYRADGRRTGFAGITLTTRFTAAGVPLEHYKGTLPVRAFGDKDGSPFEAVVEFPADQLRIAEEPEAVRLSGRTEVLLDRTIPEGWYRPHVEIFVELKGTEKRTDLRHLGITLGPWVNERADSIAPRIPQPRALNPADLHEFLKEAQVLPNVQVGQPEQPRLVFTLFSDVAAHGQSGLLAKEDADHAGVSNRSRFPTPFVLQPGSWETTPSLPGVFPSSGLAGLFQGYATLPREIESWLDLNSGRFQMVVIGPDGRRDDLGLRHMEEAGDGSPMLQEGPFVVDLPRTGEYVIELTGCFDDALGRPACGGGTYELTCALPISFSSAVKPGTNFLVGSRYPAVLDLNPAVAADVRVDLRFFPGSDRSRVQDIVVEGTATRFGYFAPEVHPAPFEEPGEYSSLLSVRWVDQSGNLWLGLQSSAGVVAPAVPGPMRIHGTRTSFFEPRPDLDKLGAFDRYHVPFEGGSSFAEESSLSFYDHALPYHSGDTLVVPTTYPLESVIGATLAMSAQTDDVRARMEELFLPDGPLAPYPIANRFRKLWYLPDVYKLSEDNFAYHTVEPGVMDNLPVLPVSEDGWSPYAWPEKARLDAYAYLSVIRPGLPVLSIAFSGNFLGPCWIISPNDYGYRFHSSPNGDLPEDLYRVMAGLVVKDRETGEAWYDAYSAGIRITPPGTGWTGVHAPGEVPITRASDRDDYVFMGLDTSGVFAQGHELLLGGTLMPPTFGTVHLDVEWPSGKTMSGSVRTNRLGGVPPLRGVVMDEPGVYKVRFDIVQERTDGELVHGDVVGSGDGEILYFALPEEKPRVMASPLPAMGKVEDLERIEIPLVWAEGMTDVRLTWSVMTPGALYDEDWIEIPSGNRHDFVWRPRQVQLQLPNFDTIDYETGEGLLTDIVVFVFFLEGQLNGEPVYDAVRVLMRGDVLINPDALIEPELLRGAGGMVGEPPEPGASYPMPSYRREVDLDGLRLEYGDEHGEGDDRRRY